MPSAPFSAARANQETRMPTINVIYFGTTGAFSAPPLIALLRAGYDVRAVVLAALDRAAPIRRVPVAKAHIRGRSLPLLAAHNNQNIVAQAVECDIPVWEVGNPRATETRETLAGYAPDALCVACFARKLPASLLSLPRLGALNVHPSLLPDNRGPDPLFWTFWRGDEATGATIHLMDERFDAGPILAQQGEPVPDGMTEAALEARLANLGGELLVRSLGALATGSTHLQPQNETRATAFPWPTEEDYLVTPAWPARRAYRFLTGIAQRSTPARLALDGATFVISEALGYEAQARLDAPWRLEDDLLIARFTPGVLRARIRR
jgi:methionyl-tRNA formyltransferase